MKTLPPEHRRSGRSRPPASSEAAPQPTAATAAQSPPSSRLPSVALSPPLSLLAGGGAVLLWAAQPPLQLWPLAWVALVPWMLLSLRPAFNRRQWLAFYGIAVLYWAVTMQGLRHAHPLMYGPWLALAFYLGLYPLAWMALVRTAMAPLARRSAAAQQHAAPRCVPLWLAAPVVWVGLECIRNYLLTGISAVMLGHSQADVPAVIQIADAWGSYGISFVIVLVNAALASAIAARWPVHAARWPVHAARWPVHAAEAPVRAAGGTADEAAAWLRPRTAVLVAAGVLLATLGYGYWRLAQADATARPSGVNIALLGRDEAIHFEQDSERELEIFDAYFQQAYTAAQQAAARGITLDAVVWPESMFTGALPWLACDPSQPLVVPPGLELSEPEFRELVLQRQQQFERRAGQVQTALRTASGQPQAPTLIAGCSVVNYNPPSGGHSGCVQIGSDGRVERWYAKMHLVMFGEYIPLMQYLPWIDRIVPPGMGILPGAAPLAMPVGDLQVTPNICIETAVERVPLNQVRHLIARGTPPDMIVNITNDGWFDRTSIIDHHLRCSQLVAVACRRPVLIAANGGPTAWIDGSGRVVQRLEAGSAGAILAGGDLDGRSGLYLRIGDLPAQAMALTCVLILLVGVWRNRADRPGDRVQPRVGAD